MRLFYNFDCIKMQEFKEIIFKLKDEMDLVENKFRNKIERHRSNRDSRKGCFQIWNWLSCDSSPKT